jgi:hypothetical protein
MLATADKCYNNAANESVHDGNASNEWESDNALESLVGLALVVVIALCIDFFTPLYLGRPCFGYFFASITDNLSASSINSRL